MDVLIGDQSETVGKDQSTLEMVAYRDMWGKGTDSYLQMIYERFVLMRDLLADNGSIYVHCDWKTSGYIHVVMDEVFGKENFRNEVIWHYPGREMHITTKFNCKHDTIFFYAKSDQTILRMDQVAIPYDKEERLKGLRRKVHKDPDGREWVWETRGQASGQEPYKRFVEEIISQGKALNDVWSDLQFLRGNHPERVDYPTQKPEALIERIIQASSIEGNLVGDFFCGSGTTGMVAERLGRRWVMTDLGRFAIHTSRKRLIDLQRTLHSGENSYRAFDVYNLGRYERQWWQQASLKGADEEHRRVVLEFFQAEQLSNAPSPLIHGRKGRAFCHVASIDSMFSRDQARAVAKAVAATGGQECYCLAWEFEMDLRLTLSALEQETRVKLKPIPIPREIMERNRKSPPPFLEMAVLEAEPVYRGGKTNRTVDLKLTKFLPSLAEVPTKELEALKERAVKSGFDFIDFWAIDFDWHSEKPFNHHWQDYRTRKDRSLKTVSEAGHKYSSPGRYTACVKVVDVFGCDTSITVEVTI
jgi:DNA modification methylase